MSTIFGIHKENFELVDDELPTNIDKDDFIEVAFRTGKYIRWTHPIAEFLSDDLKVYPLDNTAQGIYTIGDIKNFESFKDGMIK